MTANPGTIFLGQLLFAGFFRRVVQVLAILGLLNLNSYFTTPSQIPILLPIGLCIILLLILVSTADVVSDRLCDRVVGRLECIQSVSNPIRGNPQQPASPAQQRHYLRTVFLPLITSAPPVPLLILVLLANTPLLFVVSVFQAVCNSLVVRYYNKAYRSKQKNLNLDPVSSPTFLQDYPSYLVRASDIDLGREVEVIHPLSKERRADNDGRTKKNMLRTSNLIFRGIILIVSVILAAYKLSSLGSVVGFFILNNTLRYCMIVIAEYCFPSCRALTLSESFQMISLALQPEDKFVQKLENEYTRQDQALTYFDQLIAHRLAMKPYLRLKDFRLLQNEPTKRIFLNGITARIELTSITLLHVQGPSLVAGLSRLCSDQLTNLLHSECQGVAVCAQLPADLNFWRAVPIADFRRNRVVGPSISDHFAAHHQDRLVQLIQDYDLITLYLEGDPRPSRLEELSRRQFRRLRSLVTLLDPILNPCSLWLLPFVFDAFEEGEIPPLLELYHREVSESQRSVFLLSRLPASISVPCSHYELKNSSLKKCT